MVLDIVALIRAASMPVTSLKSTFSKESFLLSEINRLLAFLPGLLPNTMREVRWLGVGLPPPKTSWITSVSGSPNRSQHRWYRYTVRPSVPGAACGRHESRTDFTLVLDGMALS